MEITPVYNRKFARNMLKKRIGSNRIQKAWKDYQIKKYGLKEYINMRFVKVARSKWKSLQF